MPRPSSARARKPRPRRPPALGVRAKLWLTLGPRTLFGEGKAELLEWIASAGALGRGGGRLRLSARGRRFVAAYRAFRAPLEAQVRRAFRRVFGPGGRRRLLVPLL